MHAGGKALLRDRVDGRIVSSTHWVGRWQTPARGRWARPAHLVAGRHDVGAGRRRRERLEHLLEAGEVAVVQRGEGVPARVLARDRVVVLIGVQQSDGSPAL